MGFRDSGTDLRYIADFGIVPEVPVAEALREVLQQRRCILGVHLISCERGIKLNIVVMKFTAQHVLY